VITQWDTMPVLVATLVPRYTPPPPHPRQSEIRQSYTVPPPTKEKPPPLKLGLMLAPPPLRTVSPLTTASGWLIWKQLATTRPPSTNVWSRPNLLVIVTPFATVTVAVRKYSPASSTMVSPADA